MSDINECRRRIFSRAASCVPYFQCFVCCTALYYAVCYVYVQCAVCVNSSVCAVLCVRTDCVVWRCSLNLEQRYTVRVITRMIKMTRGGVRVRKGCRVYEKI